LATADLKMLDTGGTIFKSVIHFNISYLVKKKATDWSSDLPLFIAAACRGLW